MKHEVQKIEIKPRKEGEAISNVHLFINGTEIRNIRKLEFKTEPKLEYFIEHIGFDIIEGYADVVNGDKKINETNLELSVKVLTALSSALKAVKC